ncbi:MAG: glycyl-radical enzyme activating protein [Oscillospiraceae bacterium]|jgi:pyruvate formate lyase activating enzyme|nr:glycyl-radical enzyme activating protein [Oscillospiraceae bacterium]
MSIAGMVFDIQRYCVHDGPGIRTTVFLKGCNLRCFWCHNPESYRREPDLLHYPAKCIGCGKCAALCPNGCHGIDADGAHVIDRKKCTCCGLCAKRCYAGALAMSGKERTAEDVMKTVRADAAFYKNSGGGVTLSGGDPMMQPEFCLELLKAARVEGIHTALDTAANYDFCLLEPVLPYVSLLLVDCKCMDAALHKQGTGADNARILKNLRRLGQGSVPLWVRVPVVPGLNDTEENTLALRAFLADLPAVQKLELLPYHNLGASKHASLGLACAHADMKPPAKERVSELAALCAGAHYAVGA